jgi:hypothetical protein
MRFVRDAVITTQSAAGNLTSIVVDANQLLSISAQAIATGTIAGTLKMQVSNDLVTTPATPPTNWTDVSGVSVAISGAGTALIPKTDLTYRWIRFVYTATSGTGNLTVNIDALSL